MIKPTKYEVIFVQTNIVLLPSKNHSQHINFVSFYYSKVTYPKDYILEILVCSMNIFGIYL